MKFLKPRATWDSAIIGIKNKVTYSLSLMIEVYMRESALEDSWDAVFEHIEYYFLDSQSELGVEIDDDLDDSIDNIMALTSSEIEEHEY